MKKNSASDLSEQINIGAELEKKLLEIGISSFAKLKKAGSKNAILSLKRNNIDVCCNMLYALEGAIQGIRWHKLKIEEKRELKEYLDSIM